MEGVGDSCQRGGPVNGIHDFAHNFGSFVFGVGLDGLLLNLPLDAFRNKLIFLSKVDFLGVLRYGVDF